MLIASTAITVAWYYQEESNAVLFCGLARNPRPNVSFGTGGESDLELRKLLYYPRPNGVQPGGHCTTKIILFLENAFLLKF